jgi:phenylacetate-coenzyme A ligase PaaK-like adenylate-forming protein
MFSTFARLPIKATAYSGRPFSLLDGGAHEDLAAIMEIDLIENGDRHVRELWQDHQLANVASHARAHSALWRKRIPKGVVNRQVLRTIPVLTREDVREQVRTEGSLVNSASTQTYASSGSTGTPVTVHVTDFNTYYHTMRGLAQSFMDGRPLTEPRTFIRPASAEVMLDRWQRLSVQRFDTWIGRLGSVFADAPHKIIQFAYDESALLDELRKDKVGYLACPSSFLNIIMRFGGVENLLRMGVSMWLHHSDNFDADLAMSLRENGIVVRSSYSCSEVGAIASECIAEPGNYHIAHSNVIVECDKSDIVTVNEVDLGRILITQLHSYATPLIRYDVGDFGHLAVTCPCGHDGPTLSRLHGRAKFFLRHPDGRLLPFHAFSASLFNLIKFTEFRIHQPDTMTIVVEIGGHTSLSSEVVARIKTFITRASDPVFRVEVRAVPSIDWSRNPKRLAFTSAVA